MNHRTLLFALSLVMFSQQLLAQNLTFTRNFGGPRLDDARGLVSLPDGCLAFTGLTKSAEDTLGTMYLTKTNAAGAELWSHRFDRQQEDGGNHLMAMRDGGFLITGHTALSYGKLCDGFLVRTDADGNELWRAIVGGADDDVCFASIELLDGSIVTVGRTEDAATHRFRVLFAKLDASGNQVFMKQLGDDQPCMAVQIQPSSDGNLFLAGFDYFSENTRDSRLMVMKCSLDGDILWKKTVENLSGSWGNTLIPAPNGGCIAVGGIRSLEDSFEKACLVRFDIDGRILAQKTLPETDGRAYFFDGKGSAAGHFAATGITISAAGNERPVVVDFSENLEFVSKIELPLDGARPRCLEFCPDGTIALAGLQKTNSTGLSDIFLAKTSGFDKNLAVLDVFNAEFLLFPNPFSEQAYLKIGHDFDQKTLVIMAENGRIIRESQFSSPEFFIEKTGLPPGICLFLVKNSLGQTLKSGRLVISD